MPKIDLTPEIAEFVKPLLERVEFVAPDLAAATCGCGCGCSGGGGGGGGGGNSKLAQTLIAPDISVGK